MTQTKNIAIIGYGNVGRGFYELYNKITDPGFRISAIAERHPEKLPGELRSLFRLASEVVHDPDIDLVVEVTNNADEAFTLVEEALREGKKVVSANKKMLARNLKTLEPFIRQGRLRFEAAACASIPVFRIIDSFYSQEPLTRIRGIFNGTCNYLLTRMEGEGRALPELIADAQALGFAEADPTDDVEGHDTLYKLILLAYSAWGQVLSPAQIQRGGISGVEPEDVLAAKAKGQRLKLVADATWDGRHLHARVGVEAVTPEDPIFATTAENNILQVFGEWSGPQHYVGRGAGSWPTGKAVLQDVTDLLKPDNIPAAINRLAFLN